MILDEFEENLKENLESAKYLFESYYIWIDPEGDYSLNVAGFGDPEIKCTVKIPMMGRHNAAFEQAVDSAKKLYGCNFTTAERIIEFARIVQKEFYGLPIDREEDKAEVDTLYPNIPSSQNPITIQEDIEEEAAREAKEYLDNTVGKPRPLQWIQNMGRHTRRANRKSGKPNGSYP